MRSRAIAPWPVAGAHIAFSIMTMPMKILFAPLAPEFLPLILGVFWAFATGITATSAEVVYDNSLTLNPNSIHDGTVNQAGQVSGPYEFGDDITLAGKNRVVNQFVFHYFGDVSSNSVSLATIRFYANDATMVDPVSGKTLKAPGSLLWQSDPFQIAQGKVEASILVPKIVVPDTFTFTLDTTGLSGSPGDRFALYTSSARAKVGSSFNDFWSKTPSGWVISNFRGNLGSPRADFVAQVIAETPVLSPPTRIAGKLVIAWSGGKLESSEGVSNTWKEVPGAVSPLELNSVNGNLFYRVRIDPIEPPVLGTPSRRANNAIFTWNHGKLESSSDPSGPWTEVPNAKSPYEAEMSLAPQRFYRIRQ